jgi:hypothetical protein
MPPVSGDWGLVSTVRSRPQHGTGEFVEVAAGPGARRGGVGKCAGANAGLIARRSSVSHLAHKTTVPACCLSASRHVRQGSKRRVRPATLDRCHCHVPPQCNGPPFAQERAAAAGVGLRREAAGPGCLSLPRSLLGRQTTQWPGLCVPNCGTAPLCPALPCAWGCSRLTRLTQPRLLLRDQAKGPGPKI